MALTCGLCGSEGAHERTFPEPWACCDRCEQDALEGWKRMNSAILNHPFQVAAGGRAMLHEDRLETNDTSRWSDRYRRLFK